MGAGNDRPGGDAFVYALTDEAAYLQTDDDEKPVFVHPPHDPAQFKCWFCRKSHQQVQRPFGAKYPVRDPNNLANETLIFICNECVARFAEWAAREAPRTHLTAAIAKRGTLSGQGEAPLQPRPESTTGEVQAVVV